MYCVRKCFVVIVQLCYVSSTERNTVALLPNTPDWFRIVDFLGQKFDL